MSSETFEVTRRMFDLQLSEDYAEIENMLARCDPSDCGIPVAISHLMNAYATPADATPSWNSLATRVLKCDISSGIRQWIKKAMTDRQVKDIAEECRPFWNYLRGR